MRFSAPLLLALATVILPVQAQNISPQLLPTILNAVLGSQRANVYPGTSYPGANPYPYPGQYPQNNYNPNSYHNPYNPNSQTQNLLPMIIQSFVQPGRSPSGTPNPYNQNHGRTYDSYNPGYGQNNYSASINQIYLEVLGRNADSQGLATFSRNLASGQMHLGSVRGAIARSDESRFAINNIYRRYLCRDADPSGMNSFTNLLASGGTLQQVANNVATSPEAQSRQGCY